MVNHIKSAVICEISIILKIYKYHKTIFLCNYNLMYKDSTNIYLFMVIFENI
jgi:hypothetical protein